MLRELSWEQKESLTRCTAAGRTRAKNTLDGQEVESTTHSSNQPAHSSPSQGASQQTHQWLTSAQLSPLAWTFSWELVMPDKKPEVQFFGASTIAIKVSKCWHEVPADQVT